MVELYKYLLQISVLHHDTDPVLHKNAAALITKLHREGGRREDQAPDTEAGAVSFNPHQ
jgi:hypothetical protein